MPFLRLHPQASASLSPPRAGALRTAPCPCCLQQEVAEGALAGLEQLDIPLSLFSGSLSPTPQEALFLSQSLPQFIYTNTPGLGKVKRSGAERGTQQMNQAEAWLQSRPQLLLICGVLPWRWGRDEEGPCSGRLGSQQRRCSLSPLTPDRRSASIREQETEGEAT